MTLIWGWMKMLKVQDLFVAYGGIEALKGISLEVPEGKIVTLIGANGAGKSTLLRTIVGLVKPKSGTISYNEQNITGLNSQKIVKTGITLVPEGRRVFPNLTVLENLQIGAYMRNDKEEIAKDIKWVYELFPRLEERSWQMAGTLSGGEQQMLAVGRALLSRPQLMMMDEPSLGLAPLIIKDIFNIIQEINSRGMTILLIEHRLEEVLAYADRVLVMENGGILALDAPEKLPSLIRDNDMFQAMPVPMRIFEELSGEGDSPVTVREGREWLEEWREEKKTSESSCKNQAETVEKMSDDRDRELAEKLSDTQESETVDTPEKGRKTSLFGLFSKKSAKGSDDQQPQTVLEARDVWFRYEKELPDVVRDLNLKVQKGELYCLLGGNGTGKSTTLRLLGRIKKPYRGKLFLNGKELGTYRESELYGKLLGILPQNPQSLFVKDTVRKQRLRSPLSSRRSPA